MKDYKGFTFFVICLFALPLLFLACMSYTPKTNTIYLTEKDKDGWTFLTMRDLIQVKLKIYEDRPLRWKYEPVDGFRETCPESIVRPDNWIPGDPSYQVFYFRRTTIGCQFLVFHNQDKTMTIRFPTGVHPRVRYKDAD